MEGGKTHNLHHQQEERPAKYSPTRPLSAGQSSSHVTDGRWASLLEETQSDQKQQPEQEMSCNISVCCSASLSMNKLQIHSNRSVRHSDPAHSQLINQKLLSLINQSKRHRVTETEEKRHITIPSRPLMEPVSSFITNAVRGRLSRPPRPEQTCSSYKVQ